MIAKLHGGSANLKTINIPDGLREVYIPIQEAMSALSSDELPTMPRLEKEKYIWISGNDFALDGATFAPDDKW